MATIMNPYLIISCAECRRADERKNDAPAHQSTGLLSPQPQPVTLLSADYTVRLAGDGDTLSDWLLAVSIPACGIIQASAAVSSQQQHRTAHTQQSADTTRHQWSKGVKGPCCLISYSYQTIPPDMFLLARTKHNFYNFNVPCPRYCLDSFP